MKTDSENNVMNKLFSLHFFEGGRFFFLLLLFVNFQITQAGCRNNESASSDMATPSNTLFISEGTVVSGMEKIHVLQPAKEKGKKKAKRKNSLISNKKKQKKKENLSQPVENGNNTVLTFSRDHQSEKSLLSVSDSDNPIVRPQHMMKFYILRPENKILSLLCLKDIYFKNIHKSHWFSALTFFQNFNRPPPHALFL
ncbi:hypothetical protein [Chryseobacterium vaccae]|uniref:hypothetical protein n=1 Tax=Chryseobacterium vaccae TaxID=2604424 RepID=UPI001295A1EE|nr:hypothetical protein [Chryseobacterium vaccae]